MSKRKFDYGVDYEEQQKLRRKNTHWFAYVTEHGMMEKVVKKEDRTSKEPFSHTLMSGGILNVPIEKYKGLLFALAKDIKQGYVPDFNEISTPLTRLYMDLDFKDELTPENGIQLFSTRSIKEMSRGVGSEQFPAIVIEEEPLERQRYQNVSVADCIAEKVTEYFPLVTNKESPVFHVHCMWRAARFEYATKEYINSGGRRVSEKIITARSFGMHMVWPNLYVTHAEALDIREGVIRALSMKYHGPSINNRNKPGLNCWSSIVDEKIYLPMPSLRMVLSDKYVLCDECKNRNNVIYGTPTVPLKKRAKTMVETPTTSSAIVDSNIADVFGEELIDQYKFHCKCRGRGKIAAGSIYSYHATVDGAKNEVTETYRLVFEQHCYQMLLQCCIRDPRRPDIVKNNKLAPTDPVFVLPVDAPRYCGYKPVKTDSMETAEKKYAQFKLTDDIPSSRTYIGAKTEDEFFISSKEFNAVQNLFANSVSVVQQAKRSLPAQTPVLDLSKYQSVAVYRMRRGCINGNYFYTVEITDTGLNNDAKYCFNIDRVHKCEKNVYFKITAKNGISQRCSCFSTKNRVIPCQKFESASCPLPKGCQNILFPEELLQKGLDRERQSLILTSKRKQASLIGMDQSKLTELVEKPFRVFALDPEDASLLKQYAGGMLPLQTADEQTALASSSNSPFDPAETAKIEKYEKICEQMQSEPTEKRKAIKLSDVEESKVVEGDESKPANVLDFAILPKVEKLIEKMQRTEHAMIKEAVISKKIHAAFSDTCSPAYHAENPEIK